MKKKSKTKNDGKEFERFDELLRQVVQVPKDEIEKRDKEWQKRKEAKRRAKA